MLIAGAFLSTLFPVIGPAVAQLPALSQMALVVVPALAVSVPAPTPVISEKLASLALARWETVSLPVHVSNTLFECHCPSEEPHEKEGEVLSIRTVKVRGTSLLPPISFAKYETIVSPSAEINTEVDAPLTVVAGIISAPLALKVISLTPEPPSLSSASIETFTLSLVQPARFEDGSELKDEVGGVESYGPGTNVMLLIGKGVVTVPFELAT